MANSIEFAKNYAGILDEVYQRAAVSRCLNSGGYSRSTRRDTRLPAHAPTTRSSCW